MNESESRTTLPPVPGDAPIGVVHWPRLLALSFFAWTGLCLFQAVASYVDHRQAGRDVAFLEIMAGNAPYYLPWMLFSTALYWLLSQWRQPLNRVGRFCLLLLVFSVVFMTLWEAFMVFMALVEQGRPMALFVEQFRQLRIRDAFLDYVLFLGCFSLIYAIALFQRTLRDERRRQRMEAEMLSLRLELEQSRFAALQAQLEPHFMFNALNALSALVRSGETARALSAIQRLSELLRYAIAASVHEWSSIGDEMAFVEDYVSLQRLRYGERLCFRVQGLDALVRGVACPPLLLQPLIENALRHSLEQSTQDSDILVDFRLDGGWLHIGIQNPLVESGATTKGFGIGLRNIRDRLALVYGDQAAILSQARDACFVVDISIPSAAEEGDGRASPRPAGSIPA